jgi:hypothetical protein
MQFNKPEVGSDIEVVTATPNPSQPFALPKHYRGRVVQPFKWAGPNDFCMTTDQADFPVRVIDISYVKELKYVDGTVATTVEVKPVPKIESWTVDGSKGDVYIVTRDGTKWSCDCVAGKFNRHCKHVSLIQKQQS